MKKTFYPLICLASCVTCLRAELADGVIPSGSTVMQLATLPAGGAGTSDADVVRLAPDGRPTVSANGHIVSLIEERGEPFFEWTPVQQDGGKLVDYCFLDTERIAVLQETRLKIVQNEGCVVNYTLPSRGGRLSRADGHHCYLFGGALESLLLVGADGSVSNLLQSSGITAVAGDGRSTFAAVGDTVYFLDSVSKPSPVLMTRNPVVDLALGSSNSVFYVTSKGVGCMTRPGSAWVFWPQKVLSVDCRADRLLLLTANREVYLIDPVTGFPALIDKAVVPEVITRQP